MNSIKFFSRKESRLNPETIGIVSGLLVVVSIIPYAIRTYQGKIQPNLTSWSLWTLIGLALLLTYKGSGAGANLWPALFGFSNPLLITILVLRRKKIWERPNKVEVMCFIVGIASLTMWAVLRESRQMCQYALYLALFADVIAAIPTFTFVWSKPSGDRPFAWFSFAIGYGLALFSITEHTFTNYLLPVYMFVGALSVTFPLARYRWRNKVPLLEWI